MATARSAKPRQATIPSRTESAIAEACDRLARALGYTVESYSDSRAVRTHAGLPDRRYVHAGRGVRLWVETKKPRGKLDRAQFDWLQSELAAGGLATVIDDDATLRALFTDLARNSSIANGMVRDRCAELIRLCAMRGFRDEKQPTPHLPVLTTRRRARGMVGGLEET